MSRGGDIILHNLRDGLEVFRLGPQGATFVCKIPLLMKKRYRVQPACLLRCGDNYVLCNGDDRRLHVWDSLTGQRLHSFAAVAGA